MWSEFIVISRGPFRRASIQHHTLKIVQNSVPNTTSIDRAANSPSNISSISVDGEWSIIESLEAFVSNDQLVRQVELAESERLTTEDMYTNASEGVNANREH